MLSFLRDLRLNVKLSLLGAGGVLITAAALVSLAVWQSGQYNALAQSEVDLLVQSDLDHIARGVLNLVRTENEAVQQQVDWDLEVARHVLADTGAVSLSREVITWEARDQFTGQTREARLPKMLVGGRWLGQNYDPAVAAPVVDEVTRLVGQTATLFQRMNARGDMIRVATTVKDTDGRRAIGTYIPAANPDGTPNPVVAAALRGEHYHGRAFVVNAWYLTAYEPLTDPSGKVIGMLYVGIRQESIEERVRQAILRTRVGRTGYVYVVGAHGNRRGRYVVSQSGGRDGEDIWEVTDSDGHRVTQSVVNRALALRPGELATLRYRWRNPGDPGPRWKIVRIAYYAPWDWVIGTSVYEDELGSYASVLRGGRVRMTRTMGGAGLLITLLVGLVGILIAYTIARPIGEMTEAAQTISRGDLGRKVAVSSRDEIGVLAKTFNLMTDRLRCTLADLRESEAKYRGIFEGASEGLFQSSLEGRILSANPAMARILGYDSPEELIASVTDIGRQIYLRPEDRDATMAGLLEQGTLRGREIQVRRRDGEVIWVAVSTRLARDGAGRPLLVDGHVSDVTARRHAEDALNESQEHYRALFEHSPVPIWEEDLTLIQEWIDAARASGVTDFRAYFNTHPEAQAQCVARRRLLAMNRATLALVHAKSCEHFLANMESIFPEETQGAFRESLVALAEGKTLFEGEASIATVGGERLFVIVRLRVVPGRKQSGRALVSLLDITAHKQAEERRAKLEAQLRQAQRMETVGLLAGGVAHDFNNLLTPILGYAQLMARRLPEEDPHRVYLQHISHAAERARDLTHRLLAFSRKQVIELKVIDLGELIHRSEAMLSRMIRENVRIQVDVSPSLGCVRADAAQIEQVLFNLAVNAQDAMPEGGELALEVTNVDLLEPAIHRHQDVASGPYVMLRVSDTGMGMDQETVERVFEPFFTTKELGRGTGLGLSTVYGIVKQHGGSIAVRSERGRGSTFEILIPRLIGESAAVESGLQLPAEIARGAETVLVVEDDDMVRMLTSDMLRGLGYQVLVVESPERCIDLVNSATRRIDLLLTDIVMPKMNGKELFEVLQGIRPALRVLFMSGYTSEVIGHQGVLDERTPLLRKPFSQQALAEQVRRVLDG